MDGSLVAATGPVAQSVERWTPYGGGICPGFKNPGFEARRAPDVYRASWRASRRQDHAHGHIEHRPCRPAYGPH